MTHTHTDTHTHSHTHIQSMIVISGFGIFWTGGEGSTPRSIPTHIPFKFNKPGGPTKIESPTSKKYILKQNKIRTSDVI